MSPSRVFSAALLAGLILGSGAAHAAETAVQLGPRPFFLMDRLDDGPLKEALQACDDGRAFTPTAFSIGHRGAPMQFPEHTVESYRAAARMGAGIVECDVTFTKDRQLVCRHSQCDLHTTTDILAHADLAAKCTQPFSPADPATGKKASATCCTSDITLDEFRRLKGKMDGADSAATTIEGYMAGTPGWRTDLYTGSAGGTLMTHAESIALFRELGVKFTPELKEPSVGMPFDGDYTQEAYAQQMLDEYTVAGVDPADVYPQSFRHEDVLYWLKAAPEFGKQAVWLDDRYDIEGFDSNKPETFEPSMQELADLGVKIIAPPLFMLVTADADGTLTPSAYAKAAKEAGLKIIAWSLERSGPLAGGGGWYYLTVNDAIHDDADTLVLLDVLAKQVGVMGVFSDWPATTTFYANCMGL